ncbi:MAG: Outer membrane protein assembly factor BamA [Candidatus Anoxychlamydiales bacterium]|nr:Outer membrane protein assembly factor BamA [Candidatus Anoxychlamydiales bacterium]
MKKLFSLIVLFFSVTQIFANNYENQEIADVKIVLENPSNNVSFNKKNILQKLQTKKGDLFFQNIFDNDIKKLSLDFDRIEPEVNTKDSKVYITIKLWQRPVIRKINFHGNSKIKTSKLQKELNIKPNEIYNRETFNKAILKVKEFYLKKGYFDFDINYKVSYLTRTEVKIDIFIKEGRIGKVKKIVFKGFTKKEKSDVQDIIFTKKYNFLTSWFNGTGTFKEDGVEQDKVVIINYLQNKGYADAKVDINILEDPESKKLIIEIIAHRGTLYRFGKITFDGNTLLTNDEILKSFIIHPNDTFSSEKIRQTSQSIKDLYGSKGYIETQVYYETMLLENEPVYNVNFYIDEGDCYKIGLIKIYGNKSTRTSVILRESLLIPGETFDIRKLNATQNRLQNIGYFKSVNVYATQSTDPALGANYRDVHIEVEEESTGHASLSAGFNTSENVSGTLDLTENNFDHRGLYRIFSEGPSAFRGGGEYAQVKGTLGKRQKNYSLNWMTPYFNDTLWRFGTEFSGTFSRLQSPHYKIKTYGGSVYTSYPLSNFLSYGFKYRARHTDNIVKTRGRSEEDIKTSTKAAKNDTDGLISGLGGVLNYDSTDNSYKPHKGLRSSLDMEYVGIGGDYDFYKIQYLNAFYYSLWSRGTLKYKTNLRFITAIGSLKEKKIPISERFFLGGETTVRGYKPYIIGPRMIKDDKDAPKGGTSSVLLSIEYLQEVIRPLLDVFVFVDAGSIKFSEFSVSKINASTGIGVRLEVMNRVPITVGWGYPINANHHSDQQRLFFSMGTQF